LALLERVCEKTLSTDANWQPRLRQILASASPTSTVAFVGVGHPMRGDDFVGSFILKKLIKRIRRDSIVFFDAEDGIEWVISKIAKSSPKHLIILDACQMNAGPGDITLIPLAKTDYPFFTTHGIPLKLLTGKLLPSVETSILAIQPHRMGLNENLSPEVLAAADSISDFIVVTLNGSESS
jgi:hydrogenase 3 maturation protease